MRGKGKKQDDRDVRGNTSVGRPKNNLLAGRSPNLKKLAKLVIKTKGTRPSQDSGNVMYFHFDVFRKHSHISWLLFCSHV